MSPYLQTLFDTLNEGGIKYILLTDFESDFASGDIDLFVDPVSKPAFEKALRELGWYKRREPSYHYNHHFYYSPQSEIYLDVKYALSFAYGKENCYTYLHTDQALSEAILNGKGVYRPAGTDAVILYAAHLAYRERGKLEAKHSTYLNQYISIYRSEFREQFAETMERLCQWLEEKNLHNIEGIQTVLSPHFRHQRTKMVRNNRYLRYGYGMKVLFLGTDGSGKTTLINAVENRLNLKTNKLYLGMGEDGWTSPWVKSLYNRRLNLKLIDKAFSFLKSFVVLPAELLLRQVPVKLRSRYSVVLIDRVPGANLMDKAFGKRLLYKSILPKPDLVFFLYASPEVLLQRKPAENTLERSRADILKFREVADLVSAGKYIGIDTSNISIKEATDAIISEIYRSQKIYDNLLTERFE